MEKTDSVLKIMEYGVFDACGAFGIIGALFKRAR